MLRRAPFLFLLAALLATVPLAAQQPAIPIQAHSVELAETPDADFGRLRPLGMLELPSLKIGNASMSQLSALAWDDDDGILYALSDKGWLFHLEPRFSGGRLSEVWLRKTVALTDLKDGKPLKSRNTDAEGTDILNSRNGRQGDAELLISFERTPRILRYRPDGKALGELPLPPALAKPKAYESPNRMLESVCADPELGVLTAAEAPLASDTAGITSIFAVDGRQWHYPLRNDSRITALECLGDRRVLVLERDFSITRQVVTLRIATLPVVPGDAPVGVTTVVTLDRSEGFQIDNFEGLTRHKGNRFFMVSDNNDLFLQRTLLLYFELLE